MQTISLTVVMLLYTVLLSSALIAIDRYSHERKASDRFRDLATRCDNALYGPNDSKLKQQIQLERIGGHKS